MPKVGSPSFKVLLVDGYNLLAAKVQGVAHEIEIELEPSDGLGDDWREKSPTGMRSATLEQSGAFFDTAANSVHEAMKDLPETERLIAWAVAGNVIGAIFTAVKGAFTSTYGVISTGAKLTKANVKYAITGQVDEGVILQDHVVVTADGDNASVDNGVSTADGGVGYQLASDLVGITGFVGTIRDSADDVVYADLLPFANVTAAPHAQRIEVAGAVDRYLRYSRDVTGTGSIKPFVGFTRNSPPA